MGPLHSLLWTFLKSDSGPVTKPGPLFLSNIPHNDLMAWTFYITMGSFVLSIINYFILLAIMRGKAEEEEEEYEDEGE